MEPVVVRRCKAPHSVFWRSDDSRGIDPKSLPWSDVLVPCGVRPLRHVSLSQDRPGRGASCPSGSGRGITSLQLSSWEPLLTRLVVGLFAWLLEKRTTCRKDRCCERATWLTNSCRDVTPGIVMGIQVNFGDDVKLPCLRSNDLALQQHLFASRNQDQTSG